MQYVTQITYAICDTYNLCNMDIEHSYALFSGYDRFNSTSLLFYSVAVLQVHEPQFVKTSASPSQTKSRYRRSKFLVRTVVRPRFHAATSCCLRDSFCNLFTENSVCAGVYAVPNCYLKMYQPVTNFSNIH